MTDRLTAANAHFDVELADLAALLARVTEERDAALFALHGRMPGLAVFIERCLSRINDERRALAKALPAAISALRSYEHGNASPDLAKEIADHCAAVLAETQP